MRLRNFKKEVEDVYRRYRDLGTFPGCQVGLSLGLNMGLLDQTANNIQAAKSLEERRKLIDEFDRRKRIIVGTIDRLQDRGRRRRVQKAGVPRLRGAALA